MSQRQTRQRDSEKCHILYHKEFVYCLLCKQDITTDPDSSLHLLETKHQENRKTLFKSYVHDPFVDSTDNRYVDVVINLTIDISKLLTECKISSYVYQLDNLIICLVCRQTISKTTNLCQIKNMLDAHLGSNSHIENMNDNINWGFPTNEQKAYIKFQKSPCGDITVYCSSCDLYLSCFKYMKFHSAVNHLQTAEHKLKLKIQSAETHAHVKTKHTCNDQLARDYSEEMDSINQSLQNVGFKNEKLSKVQNTCLQNTSIQSAFQHPSYFLKPPRKCIEGEFLIFKELEEDPMLALQMRYIEEGESLLTCRLCNITLHGWNSVKEHISGLGHCRRLTLCYVQNFTNNKKT